MLNKNFFFSLLLLTGALIFIEPTQIEARSHKRMRTGVHVSVNTAYNDPYVSRRYIHPVAIAPVVYSHQTIYSPYSPVYTYQAPVYVEEVYVTPAPRPAFGFGGLSFSWNFFR